MILPLLALLAGIAPGHTLHVGPTAIPTIGEAVRRSHPGDTVAVAAGVYREPTIVVDRRIVIFGVGWPVVDGQGARQLFTLTADSVEIRGLVLRNVGSSSVEDRAAIKAIEVRGCVIADNRLEDAFFGIYLARSSGCLIRGNRIEAHGTTEALSGNGIHLWSSHDVTVEDNDIRGHRDGIYLEFTTGSHVSGNVSTGNLRYGLHFMFSHDCEYRDNRFEANGAGVAVMYSHGVTMTGNRFERNWGSSAYGLLLKELTDSRVSGNTFAANSTGLYLEGTNRLELGGNLFERNGWAVILLGDAYENRFVGNVFVGNSFDVGTNSTRTQSSFHRNYWDHYGGYDLDRDGTGDVPYPPVRLFALVVQRHPPALILLRSLFVGLLDLAERVLPVLTPATLVDDAPLMRRPA
jgi:nitrous oxidase accessory protein